MTNVIVTGGAGYVGSVLVPDLLTAGYAVTVYDAMYFGSSHLPRNSKLRVVEGDIRDTPKLEHVCRGQDVILKDRKSVV